MGASLSQSEKTEEKIWLRVSQAILEERRKVVFYFNKPESRKIYRRNDIVYHSKTKVTPQQMQDFMQKNMSYCNECINFKWNTAGECLVVNLQPTVSQLLVEQQQQQRARGLWGREHCSAELPQQQLLVEYMSIDADVGDMCDQMVLPIPLKCLPGQKN